ncbi:hypothetical protein GCM10027346_29420 [Hymenobacter seoulensis]
MYTLSLPRFVLLAGLVLALLPATLVAQRNQKTSTAAPGLPEPPGTVRVAENLFMDEVEVANLHWLEYLYFVRRDSTLRVYRSQLPDSNGWKPVVLPEATEAPQSYFRAPGYRYFPATGITYEQAQAYCRWRSAAVNRSYFQGATFRKQHPELRDFDVTVEYRLPTETEWQQAAAGNMPPGPRAFDIIQTKPERKPKLQKLADAPDLIACLDALQLPHPATEVAVELPFNLRENYYLAGSGQVFTCAPAKEKFPLQPTTAGPPNGFGIHNMIGNVAEMTATKGIAKGGSFKTSAKDIQLDARQPYQGPQNWLGFRCVATVRVQKKPAAGSE